MARDTWRDHARPIIAAVIANVGTNDTRALRAALREAYPWGEKRYHPYKIWLDEIRVQLGKRQFGNGSQTRQPDADGQQRLFGD